MKYILDSKDYTESLVTVLIESAFSPFRNHLEEIQNQENKFI